MIANAIERVLTAQPDLAVCSGKYNDTSNTSMVSWAVTDQSWSITACSFLLPLSLSLPSPPLPSPPSYTHAHTHTHTHAHAHTHTHTHTHMTYNHTPHVHVHTWMHTQMQTYCMLCTCTCTAQCECTCIKFFYQHTLYTCMQSHSVLHTHALMHFHVGVIAYGAMNLVGAFFSSFTATGSLSRSTIQANSGGKTQVSQLKKNYWYM